MKLKKALVYITALSIAAISSIVVSQNDVDAAKVATTNDGNIASIKKTEP